MKAMYKSELAAYAGVSTRTLRRWLKPYQQQLAELGMKPKDQIVKPSAVKFICETLCIDMQPSRTGRFCNVVPLQRQSEQTGLLISLD